MSTPKPTQEELDAAEADAAALQAEEAEEEESEAAADAEEADDAAVLGPDPDEIVPDESADPLPGVERVDTQQITSGVTDEEKESPQYSGALGPDAV